MYIGSYKNTLPVLRFQPIKTVGKRLPTISLLLAKPRRSTIKDDWVFTLERENLLVDIVIPKIISDTDGASFPWWLTALIPTCIFYFIDNKWLIALSLIVFAALGKLIINAIGVAFTAGLIHDQLYKHHRLLLVNGDYFMNGCSRWEADRLFIEIHYQVNHIKWLAWATGLLLYSGSFVAWFKYRLKTNRGRVTLALKILQAIL